MDASSFSGAASFKGIFCLASKLTAFHITQNINFGIFLHYINLHRSALKTFEAVQNM